jgi:hypothetical protein
MPDIVLKEVFVSIEVTLKKAAELSRAALAASKAIEPKSVISMSVYSLADPAVVLASGRADFEIALERSIKLIDAAFAIRGAIGSANAEAGVDTLLTKLAAIDEIVGRYTTATSDATAAKLGGDSGADSDDLEALQRRVQQARKDSTETETRRFGLRDDVKIAVLGTNEKAVLADKIGEYKRKRAGHKDDLTAINFSTKITLSGSVVDTLRAEKLID